MDAANCPESMEGKYFLFEYFAGKIIRKKIGSNGVGLDDGKLPEANGERLIHIYSGLR
jgi:hypothetical protein